MIVRVGHIDYAVRTFTRDELRDDNTAWGRHCVEDPTIKIDAGITPREQATILIHEVIHACYYAAGQDGDTLGEEAVATMLGRMLAGVFLVNPHLSAALHQGIHHGKAIVK